MRKYLILMVVLAAVEITLALGLTFWREIFWNYVQSKNLSGFTTQLGVFTVVALILCVVSASAGYCQTLAAIKWREKLNIKALNVPIRCTKRGTEIENASQRIQEDCREYPALILNIGFGLAKALVYVVVFSISLVLQFSAMYLLYISIYAIIATLIARKVAYPLIALNYKSQQVEATYRNSLTDTNFNNCINVMTGLAVKTKHLSYFQTFYSQIGVIIPLVIIAPAYFAGGVSFGGLMQANSIMATIVESLSYGITSFDSINRLISCRTRLKEMQVI